MQEQRGCFGMWESLTSDGEILMPSRRMQTLFEGAEEGEGFFFQWQLQKEAHVAKSSSRRHVLVKVG